MKEMMLAAAGGDVIPPPVGELLVLTSGYIVIPANVTSISIACLGAGGSSCLYTGSHLTYANFASPGGAGGAMSWRNNIAVIPGQSITAQVGAGGVATTARGNDGGDTYVLDENNEVMVIAGGGKGALRPADYAGNISPSPIGGLGGLNINPINTGGYNGGRGGRGDSNPTNFTRGGGGGSATLYQNGPTGGDYYTTVNGVAGGGGRGIVNSGGGAMNGNPTAHGFPGGGTIMGYCIGNTKYPGLSAGYQANAIVNNTIRSVTYGGGGAGTVNGGNGAILIIWGAGREFPLSW